MEAITATDRTKDARIQIRRHPERGVYEKERIYAILDEACICHVGFAVDGQPYVIPTAYGRAGDQIYIHGSSVSRMLRSLAQGVAVCVTVTLVDGFVLARSAFRHSLNYRSVVILGTARLVTDAHEKMDALRCITNHLVPGRWEEVRQPNDKEMMATSVLAVPLDEASAKVRSGPPLDAESDWAVTAWAGVLPVHTRLGEPVPDGHVPPDMAAIDKRRFTRKV
jgi:hypothetical protein